MLYKVRKEKLSLKLRCSGSQTQSPYNPAPALPISSRGPEFDVESSDAQLLAPLGYILGSQHGSIWRRLISVCLYLHPTSYTADGFPGDKSTGSFLFHLTRTQSIYPALMSKEICSSGMTEDENQLEHASWSLTRLPQALPSWVSVYWGSKA